MSANVPMRASVATIPRTVSSANVASMTSPRGRSVRACHSSSSPTREATSPEALSGSSTVGKSRWASEVIRP